MHSSIKRCCTFCQQTLGRCRSFLAREAATAQSGLAVPGLSVEKKTQAWTLCQRKFASKMFKNILHQHCTPALFAASHHPAVNLANMHPAGTVTSTSNRTRQHPKKAPAPVPKTASAPAAPQKKTAVLEQHPPKKSHSAINLEKKKRTITSLRQHPKLHFLLAPYHQSSKNATRSPEHHLHFNQHQSTWHRHWHPKPHAPEHPAVNFAKMRPLRH